MQAPQTPLAGHYRFSRSLQTGAKSVSWLAIDEKTRRTVIASALGAARVAGLEGIVGVRHPHLAAIVDVIHDADPGSVPAQAASLKSAAIAVAEYVHGTTLHELLRSTGLEVGEAVEIVDKLAQAVESLHAIGGVHGAISPRSVVTSPENGPTGPVLTQLIAPPSGSYCSPERLRGHGPSTVDDMWALHATLYATLTGATPFSGTSREQLVRSMVSAGFRPLSEHGVDDATLQDIVARGLASEPARRCTDVTDLREALHAWKASRTAAKQAQAPAPLPIQPSDDDEAEWDDDNAQTIVSSAAELLAAAREAGGLAASDLLDDADEDEAPTSIVDVSALGFPQAPPPPPAAGRPPPPPPSSSPRAAPPPPVSQPGASAYAEEDDDEDAATRILDSDTVLGLAGDAVRSEPPPPAPYPYAPAAPAGFPGAPGPFPAAGPPGVPPPATPEDATILASSRQPAASGSRGVVLWALFTLLVACAVAAYLLRARLMPVLTGLGLVSAPGAGAGHTPNGPTPSEKAKTVASDAGSDVATASDGAVSGDAATGATGSKSRPAPVAKCVASYFLPGTFEGGEDFGFLCKDSDFRGINSQLYRRIVVAGAGKVTPGMKEWSGFDWYELAATAVIRHGCCPDTTKPIQLPKLGGPCKGVGEVLAEMVSAPPRPDNVAARTDMYAKELRCMFQKGVPRPFHYGKPPLSANRAAFEAFWQRAVSEYRK